MTHLISMTALRRSLLLLFAASMLSAHPISMTQTDGYVSAEKLRVAIDLFVEDLFLFHNLQPTEDGYLKTADIRDAMEKHKAFLLERFTVRDAEGLPLKGSVVKVEECEMGPEGIPMTDLMARSLVFHLEFPLSSRPDFLTFSQTMGTTQFGFPAIMMLRIKQEGTDVPYVAEMKSNEPHTIRLDWDHPPLKSDASEKEWQQWEATRKEKELGITSYSSVYSFLYIENDEVRHEILVPLLTIEASQPLERAEADFLEVAEQDAARGPIGELFKKVNPIKVDGNQVTPRVDRIDFYGLDFKDFAQVAQRKRVSMASARVGVILVYPAKTPPQTVELTWDMFNRFLWGAQTIVYAGDQTFTQFFSPYQKTFAWTRPSRVTMAPVESVPVSLPPARQWSVPLLSLAVVVLGFIGAAWHHQRFRTMAMWAMAGILIGSAALPWGRITVPNPFAPTPTLSAEESNAVFQNLLTNTYRAFETKEEGEIYDALSHTIEGPLLEKTYLAIREGLVMQEQGGAISRVTKVTPVEGERLEASPDDPRSFTYQATWNVEGTVEHWGHIHTRTNQYEATFTIEPVDDAWKITSLDIDNQKRLQFQTRLRGVPQA